MDFFKAEKEKEYRALGLKDRSRSVRVLDQVGKTTIDINAKRKTLAPGKRISSTGKVYWETRKNRSDSPGKKL